MSTTPISHDAITTAYRAHAQARLRGDRTEARRLADTLGLEARLTHLIFTFCLFAQIVLDHFGEDLDRAELAAFTKRLWQQHRGEARFEPLKAEMLIRAIYGEHEALAEIAHTEQTGYLWAVMETLIDPASSTTELDERFDLADQISREWIAEAFESPTLAHWHQSAKTTSGTPEPDTPTEEATDAHEATPDSEGTDDRGTGPSGEGSGR